MRSLFRLASLAGVLLLGACADGSPTSAEASLRKGPPQPPASAIIGTVYVVHGIDGRDLGLAQALPVDVEVNGTCVIPGFTFGSVAGPLELPAASYDIKVRLAGMAPCAGPAAITADGVVLPAGANVSIVAHLTAAGTPTAAVWVNDLKVLPGIAQVEPRHAGAFGAVNIVVDGATAYAGLTNGAAVPAAELRPGMKMIGIQVAPNGPVTREARLNPRPFTFTAVYAVGTLANGTFRAIVQTIQVR